MLPFLAGALLAHITTSSKKTEKKPEVFNPESLGIPYLSPEDEKLYGNNEIAGLGKPVTPNDIYQMITDKMVEMVKEASGRNYKKKWQGKVYGQGYLIPFNFTSKNRYRGVNYFLLTGFEPLENPYFLTLKQIDQLGGKLKKGSFGEKVVYFTKLYTLKNKEKDIDFASYNLKKVNAEADKNNIKRAEIKYIPILKYYNVFNGKDVEGIDFNLKDFKIGYINKPLPPSNKMPIPEAIIKHYPSPQPILKHGGDEAYFRPISDHIQMPYMADFETAQDYYRTLFHEYSHSTGITRRLNRDMTGRFGSKKYAFEELIAEWGATFLSAEAGIVFHTNKNHSEYLKHWNQALTHAKDDNKFIMRACSKAQELADYVLNRDKNGTPSFYKDLEKVVKKEPEKKTKTIENHKKLTKDELEKVNPKPFSKKPKSVSVKTAITDILKLGKFQNIKNMQATVLFNLFKENVNDTLENLTVFQSQVLKNQEGYYFNSGNYFNPHDKDDNYINVELTDTGKELVQSIKNRLESLQNQKNNYALFDGLAATAKNKDTIAFNKQVLEAKLKGFKPSTIFQLGKSKGVLKNHVGSQNITLQGGVIKKAMTKNKDHCLTWHNLINLPDYINNPVAIFKSKTDGGYVVLTEVLNELKKPLMVAIRFNKNFKVDAIRSIYSRSSNKSYELWRKEGLMIYINKKSKLLSRVFSSTMLDSLNNPLSNHKNTKKTNTNKKLGSVVINLEPTPSTPAVEYKGYATASELNEPTQEPQPQMPQQQQETNVIQETKTNQEQKQNQKNTQDKTVLGSNDIMSLKFDTLNFDGEWKEFMSEPAKNMRIAIWGKPKNGKTAGATKFANYLTNFGSILYNFADQGINKSTQDLWVMSGLSTKPNAHLTDTRDLDELDNLCASGKYDFIFIDMINTFIHRTGIKYYEFEDRFLKKYPKISFILIFEVTKSGDFKGDQGWTHLPDALVTVDSFVMENQGRYGVGHYVVWKEGLEKTNPKKYQQYFSSEKEIPATVSI